MQHAHTILTNHIHAAAIAMPHATPSMVSSAHQDWSRRPTDSGRLSRDEAPFHSLKRIAAAPPALELARPLEPAGLRAQVAV